MPNISVKSNQRILLVGRTGSGKTFLGERLVSSLPRLIVVDPKGDLEGKWGLKEWKGNTLRTLRSGDPVKVRVPPPAPVWGLKSSDVIDYYEYFFWAAYQAGDVTVYIDELYGVVPPRKAAGQFLSALYTRGRTMGIGVWGASQRPSLIPIFAMSEAEWVAQFQLTWPNDRKRMAEWVHPDCLNQPPTEHGFYLFNNRWQRP